MVKFQYLYLPVLHYRARMQARGRRPRDGNQTSFEWGAVVLWVYLSANGAKGREIESRGSKKQKNKKKTVSRFL